MFLFAFFRRVPAQTKPTKFGIQLLKNAKKYLHHLTPSLTFRGAGRKGVENFGCLWKNPGYFPGTYTVITQHRMCNYTPGSCGSRVLSWCYTRASRPCCFYSILSSPWKITIEAHRSHSLVFPVSTLPLYSSILSIQITSFPFTVSILRQLSDL